MNECRRLKGWEVAVITPAHNPLATTPSCGPTYLQGAGTCRGATQRVTWVEAGGVLATISWCVSFSSLTEHPETQDKAACPWSQHSLAFVKLRVTLKDAHTHPLIQVCSVASDSL